MTVQDAPATPRAARARDRDADVRLIVQAWLGTRAVLLLTAVVVSLVAKKSLADALGNWDVEHFVNIARHGYFSDVEMAFFPGLPLMLRAGMAVGLHPIAAGVLLSLATSALAVWALYRLGGRYAAIGWLLAPTAIFTLVPYSESPFCAAAFWAWERATRRKWGAAALCAAAACTLRVSGLFLVGALAVLALTQWWGSRDASGPRRQADRPTRSLPWLILPTGVIAAYAFYLHELTGSWTAWFQAQAAGWMRQFTWPWDCFANHWRAIQPGMYADHPGWVWIFRAELVSVLVGVVVVLVALGRRRLAEASWVGVQLLAFSLSYWFQSVCRAVLLWFPLWTQLGSFAERHHRGGWRVVWAATVLVALVVQVAWATLFSLQMWSG